MMVHFYCLQLRAFILSVLLLLSAGISFSQIYSFQKISHFNIETNPAYIATETGVLHVELEHIGSPLPVNDISSSKLSASRYFDRGFWGIGLFASSVSFEDEIKYQYAGMAMAYRNVLFDKVFVKFGGALKLLNHQTPDGYFDSYHFESLTTDPVSSKILQNVNMSVSIASPKDYYYVSFGVLNYNPSASQSEVLVFPRYYFISIGDLFKLLPDMLRHQLTFTVFQRAYGAGPEKLAGYFLKFSNRLTLNKYSDMNIGADFGKMDDNYFQLTPFVKYNRNYRKRNRYWSAKLAMGVYVDNVFYSLNKPMSQISLIYNL